MNTKAIVAATLLSSLLVSVSVLYAADKLGPIADGVSTAALWFEDYHAEKRLARQRSSLIGNEVLEFRNLRKVQHNPPAWTFCGEVLTKNVSPHHPDFGKSKWYQFSIDHIVDADGKPWPYFAFNLVFSQNDTYGLSLFHQGCD
jgi:hypothetical protein